MTPERHAKIQEIFQSAIDLPDQNRAEYLEHACDGDTELRARVERLIAASEETLTISEPIHRGNSIRECPECGRCFPLDFAACPIDGSTLRSGLPESGIIHGKYRIERRLGSGGMGAVYLATHLDLGKQFALKLIQSVGSIPQSYRERFETEARALGRLRHPHIVDVTDYGIDPLEGCLPYLVMEYLEGTPLSAVLSERRCLPFTEAARLLRMVASAVDAAHAQNIVHGDLKPANLFVTGGTGPDGSLKVVDFGLARLAHRESERMTNARASGAGVLQGTPTYMAHELFCGGEPSPASDRYALGELAYEMLTGSFAFGGNMLEVIQNQNRPPRPPSSVNAQVPVELDAPILALLDCVPGRRPATAAEAVAAMETAWLEGERRRWRQRELPRRWMTAAALAVGITLLGTTVSSTRAGRMLENRLVDARFALLPPKQPSPNIMVVALDDTTLKQDSRLLGARQADFAQMMETLFSAGAKAVAIDILPPENWSQPGEFAAAVMAHADHLALAKVSKAGEVIGPECISPLTAAILGDERTRSMFGFVNLAEDYDGKIRRAPVTFVDLEGRMEPAFAMRAIEAASMRFNQIPPGDKPTWIDYGERVSSIPAISWKDVAEKIHSDPNLFRDKLVFLGAEFVGSNDEHNVPESAAPDPVSGVRIQALIANTILADFPVRDAATVPYTLGIGLTCFGILALGLRFPHQRMVGIAFAALIFFGYCICGLTIFRTSRLMVPMIDPELSIVLSGVVAWYLARRLKPFPQALGV